MTGGFIIRSQKWMAKRVNRKNGVNQGKRKAKTKEEGGKRRGKRKSKRKASLYA